MPLPKINHPKYTLTIPSTNEKVTYKPFTVKDEKILLMAVVSEDAEFTLNNIKELIKSCVDLEKTTVEQLATFDVEYIFLKLRAKSVNEIIDLKMTKNGKTYLASVNLDKVEVSFPDQEKLIMITDEIGIEFNYPSYETITELKRNESDNIEALSNQLVKLYASCVNKVVDGDDLYVKGENFTDAEAEDFMWSLPHSAYSKIKEFFENSPELKHEVIFKSKDGEEEKVVLVGLQDFFI